MRPHIPPHFGAILRVCPPRRGATVAPPERLRSWRECSPMASAPSCDHRHEIRRLADVEGWQERHRVGRPSTSRAVKVFSGGLMAPVVVPLDDVLCEIPPQPNATVAAGATAPRTIRVTMAPISCGMKAKNASRPARKDSIIYSLSLYFSVVGSG